MSELIWHINDSSYAVMMKNWSTFQGQVQMFDTDVPKIQQKGQGVAVIEINGMITPTPDMFAALFGGNTPLTHLRAQLNEAMEDPEVEAIVLDVDSGGGRASGVDEMAAELYEAGQRKPIVAQVRSGVGSAAYYLASQANAIYADSRTSMAGSIGTRVILIDDSQAAEEAGFKVIPIDTGNMKSVGISGVPITEDQVKVIQGQVNKLQEFFEESVLRGRPNMDINKVNDGRMFLAEEALELGLIDGIQPGSTTIRNVLERVDVKRQSARVRGF